MVMVPPAQEVQIPSPMFNWVRVRNMLSFPVDINAEHDGIGVPFIEIREVSAEDEKIEKRLQELKGKEIK